MKDDYSLELSPEQMQEIAYLQKRSEQRIRELAESLDALCPGLQLEKLSKKDRERWMSLKNALTQAEIEYQTQIENLFRRYMIEHLRSLGSDPKKITQDAADRIRYLHSKGFEPAEILNFMRRNYAALFEDPAAAEQSLSALVESVITGKDADLIREKPLPPLKQYQLMNTKLALVMQKAEPDKISIKQAEKAALLYDGEIPDEDRELLGYAVRVSPENSKKDPVSTYALLDFTKPELFSLGGKRFTAFDFAVYTAVWNKYRQHRSTSSDQFDPLIITPAELWRTMNGYDTTDGAKSHRPSDQQLDEVIASIQRWAYTRIRLNFHAEIVSKYISPPDGSGWKSGFRDDALLSATLIQFQTGKGTKLTGFKILDDPILGHYAELKGQVLTVDYGMMRLGTSKSGQAVEIGHYLAKRISQMYSGHMDSRRILFESMYEDAGIQSPEQRISGSGKGNERADQTQIRRAAQKDREKVIEILRGWIPDYIRGFSLVTKDGNLISSDDKSRKILIGVEIDLIPEKIRIPARKIPQLGKLRKDLTEKN